MNSNIPLPDLNDLYFFCLVVEKGSFTKASYGLSLTKSKLSRRINELENYLGVRLLNRSTRKLSLTDIGKIVYEHSQAMVSQASFAQDAAAQVQTKPKGRIKVTCPTYFAQSEFNDIIIEFMHRYPEIRIALYASDRKVDLIEEGFDIALRFQTSDLNDSNLIAKKLGQSPSFLVSSPEYVKKYEVPESPQQLIQRAWLGKSKMDGITQIHLIHTSGQEMSVPVSPNFESNEWVILKKATCSGLGISLLPQELCQQEIKEGRLVRLLPDWSLSTANLYIIYPSRRGLIPAVRHFVDFVGEHVKKYCPQFESLG